MGLGSCVTEAGCGKFAVTPCETSLLRWSTALRRAGYSVGQDLKIRVVQAHRGVFAVTLSESSVFEWSTAPGRKSNSIKISLAR